MARAPLAALLALAILACDGGLQPQEVATGCPSGFTGICGTITIRGDIPDSTDQVYIVAYASFPTDPSQLLTFQPPLPPTLPLGDSTVTYTLPVAPGRYEWVLAVWKKVGPLDPSTLMETGFYRDPADTSLPGVVTFDQVADSIDFVVDFDQRRSISDWFPPLR
jgi:hypothetical protein